MGKATTPSYTITLKLQCNSKDYAFLDKVFACGNRIHNTVVSFARRQLERMERDGRYKDLRVQYRNTNDRVERKQTSAALAAIKHEYRLTQYDLDTYVKIVQHRFRNYIDANTAQKIADEVSSAVDKYLYGGGKEIRFRKLCDMHSISGKTNVQGIKYRDGRLVYMKRGFCIKAPARKDKQRSYYEQAMKSRIKYCRIKREIFGNGWEYYIELTLEGVSPKAREPAQGNVGIDIGTSTVAAVSDSKCLLRSLGSGVKSYEDEIARLDAMMDESKRKTNPNKFNTDGTCKKGNKDKWVFTKNYFRLRNRRSVLYRKRRQSLAQSHDRLVNALMAMGNVFLIESMSFQDLQKKANKAKLSGKFITKNKNGKTKTIEKYTKKKRFGKSIAKHAPAALVSKLISRLGDRGVVLKVNTRDTRASQYDHSTGEYKKTDLRTRTKTVADTTVQRDLYSAFLLRHSDSDLKSIRQDECIRDFKTFITNQNECMRQIMADGNDRNPCFGLSAFKTTT